MRYAKSQEEVARVASDLPVASESSKVRNGGKGGRLPLAAGLGLYSVVLQRISGQIGNSGRQERWVGDRPQGSESAMVFRRLVGGRPDVIAGEIDVLPAERRQVGEKVIGNALDLAQGSDRPVQITRVPQGDGRDEEVEAGSTVLLVFIGAVAEFEVDPVGRTTGAGLLIGSCAAPFSKSAS